MSKASITAVTCSGHYFVNPLIPLWSVWADFLWHSFSSFTIRHFNENETAFKVPLQIRLSLWTRAWLSMMDKVVLYDFCSESRWKLVVMLAMWHQRSQQWPKTLLWSQEKLFAFLKISQYLLKRRAEQHYHDAIYVFNEWTEMRLVSLLWFYE